MGICKSKIFKKAPELRYLFRSSPNVIHPSVASSCSIDNVPQFVIAVNNIIFATKSNIHFEPLEYNTDSYPVSALSLNANVTFLLVAHASGICLLWSVDSVRGWSMMSVQSSLYEGWVSAIEWLNETHFITGSTRGNLRLCSVVGVDVVGLQESVGHSKSVSCISVLSMEDRWICVSGSNDGSLTIHAISFSAPDVLCFVKRVSGHIGLISDMDSFVFAQDGGAIVVTCGEDKSFRIWSLDNFLVHSSATAVPHIVNTEDASLCTVKVSLDGRFVALASTSDIFIYETIIPAFKAISSKKLYRVPLTLTGISRLYWGFASLYIHLDSGDFGQVELVSKYHSA